MLAFDQFTQLYLTKGKMTHAQFFSHKEKKTTLPNLKPRNRIICCCHLNKISLNSFTSSLNQLNTFSALKHMHNEIRATTVLFFHLATSLHKWSHMSYIENSWCQLTHTIKLSALVHCELAREYWHV